MSAEKPAGDPIPKLRERITVPVLKQRKVDKAPIVMLTAYDYPSARLAERAEVDIILVGDSLGMMIMGYESTVPVTMEETIHHLRAVRSGIKRSMLLADLPFGSYQTCAEDAIRNAVRLMKEGGAHAVKLEGGAPIVETVRRMTDVGIPVMGHLGLTPQSVHVFGGHKTQGKEPEAAQLLLEDAKSLEAAGAFGILLEAIPAKLAARITSEIAIPTIGIGAGPWCDGQVQVWHDILGIYPGKRLRHVKRYAEIGEQIETALRAYVHEVRDATFPTEENSF